MIKLVKINCNPKSNLKNPLRAAFQKCVEIPPGRNTMMSWG